MILDIIRLVLVILTLLFLLNRTRQITAALEEMAGATLVAADKVAAELKAVTQANDSNNSAILSLLSRLVVGGDIAQGNREQVAADLAVSKTVIEQVATDLAVANTVIEEVADDLAHSHERADAVSAKEGGAAADAWAKTK